MKAITEEKLRKYIKKNKSGGLVYCSALINELEEIDQITVSKLRPMSEVKFRETILLKIKGIDEIYASMITEQCDLSNCEGWAPITLYKPKGNKMLPLTDIPNQEGYEFTGICKDGRTLPCIVHKDSVGMHCAYSLATNLKCYDQLKGWQKK